MMFAYPIGPGRDVSVFFFAGFFGEFACFRTPPRHIH